jgi:hypothetical protein
MKKATGGDAQRTRFRKGTESPPTYEELGIDKKVAARSQRRAKAAGRIADQAQGNGGSLLGPPFMRLGCDSFSC